MRKSDYEKMGKQVYADMENPLNQKIPMSSIASQMFQEVSFNLFCYTIQIVNVSFVTGIKEKDDWVLVDTGMPGTTKQLLEVVEKRLDRKKPPKAMILTHGHFDHVGTVIDLVKKWDVPVYAHPNELPYLTGLKKYPEPDAGVEGGLIAKISFGFPNQSIDLGSQVQELPSDGRIPEMPGWRWIHTPGHSPGHISLFREKDRTLIVGDAFLTVRQDSFFKVVTQFQEICGPPRYFTTDWKAAKQSVEKLAALKPSVAVTGHGMPVSGKKLSEGLERLVRDFDQVAVPDYGRYVH